MKVSEAIKKRYSCRSYLGKQVTERLIKELLELANWAPSAGNQQNRQFIVITNGENRKYLAEMNNQRQLEKAPVTILVTTKLDKESVDDYLKSLEKWEMMVNKKNPSDFEITDEFKKEFREMKYKWMISDAAAAVENLMLAAVEKGLSTCWIGIMDFKGVVERFNLPNDIVPVCLVTLGYSKEQGEPRKKRKPVEELIHWGKY